MMKFLLIVLLIAVIAVIVFLAARARSGSARALPADDRPDAVGPGSADTTAIAPPSDITTSAMASAPLPPEAEPLEQPEPLPEPEVMAESVPPMEPEPSREPLPEPDPIIEPEPPMEPEPIVEPEPNPVEPEPVIEPDTAGVGSPHGDPLAAKADEPPMEPEPVVEPEPVIEPEPDPVEPEPVIEPDTAGVGSSHGDPLAAKVDEPTTDPPRAVIDAGEMPAVDLDADAGWDSDDDRTIHADPESGLYHTPDSPGYKIGPDGQVFESEEEAQSAGFTRWDQPDEPS